MTIRTKSEKNETVGNWNFLLIFLKKTKRKHWLVKNMQFSTLRIIITLKELYNVKIPLPYVSVNVLKKSRVLKISAVLSDFKRRAFLLMSSGKTGLSTAILEMQISKKKIEITT